MTLRDDPGLHCAACHAGRARRRRGCTCPSTCNLCRCAQQIAHAKEQIDDAYRRWVGFVRAGER